MIGAESGLLWLGIGAYAFATAALLAGLFLGRERVERIAVVVAIAAFVLHTASILVRVASSGRLPVMLDYENAIAGSWVIVLVFLVVALVRPRLRVAGAAILPVVLLTLGFGATATTAITPLTPPYRSGWLAIHVMFAWITYACYVCAAGLAIVVLLRDRGSAFARQLQVRLPETPEVESLTMRLVALGFLNNAVMLVSGSIWAYRLWGSYWTWDPVETWTLITWLAFGLYLHLRLTMNWSGPKLAWVAVLGLFGVLMAFWGVQFAPSTFHLFRELGSLGRPGG